MITPKILKVKFLMCLFVMVGCGKAKDFSLVKPLTKIESRFEMLLDYPIDSLGFPRSAQTNLKKTNTVKSRDWTSGFFPGNLWQIYSLTGRQDFKTKAKQWTDFIEKEKVNNTTHDMGFKVQCSYGKGQTIEENEDYKKIIIQSAKTLSTRYHHNVSSIRSWDFNKNKWEFPVIIDNMMNLELLFEATKISGDSLYHSIAVNHANTTLKNHIRKDNSSYHVVVYDTIKGQVKQKITHQGFSDESSWARGQSWCVYGFTMAYRYTKNKDYLNQAIATAQYYINHKNLPSDAIPYWDFNDPAIPKAARDVSAATVMSSALLELYEYTKNKEYLNFSHKTIQSLVTKDYLLPEDIKLPFILNHSTGNWPKNDEIDVPLVYADYYFLETLLRSKKI